jgi:hypothetical protein
MALQLDGIILDELTSDPGSPVEGQMWFNTTTHLFKVYRNGAVTSFTDADTFAAHVSNTSNPHSTTLEQARQAGNTLAGPINMGGFAITNVAAGSGPTDVAQRQWVVDQINQKIAGLDWQESVLNRLATPPGTPAQGDRYLIIATATGAWTGQENKITEWNGSTWVFYTPNEGWVTRVEAENLLYSFDGSSWGNLGSAVSHSALLNLTNDDHLQYLPRSGVRPMTGALDMGGNNISNAGTINGVSITAHGSRHNPGGADAVATAAAVTITDTTNAEGTATSLARSDHQHAHGNRGGGTLHALTSQAGAGFYPQSAFNKTTNPTVNDDGTAGWVPGSRWINTANNSEWVCISNATGAAVWQNTLAVSTAIPHKAGRVLAASFSGNPKKATVTFSTPFADADYAVTLTPVVTVNGAGYSPKVESQVAGSFVINMGANSISSLVHVNWTAIKSGESA